MQSESTPEAPQLTSLSREAFWQRHVKLWRESGLSKMAYCQQYSLVYHQMVYWCSKVKSESGDVKQASRVSSDFIAVSVVPPVESPCALSIRLPNGITIEGVDERNAGWVGKLIEQL